MLKFEREQVVCRIGDVELGGQPGQRPTVLIGSIFFARHQIVRDAQLGLFDETKAGALLQLETEASAFTGNPRFIDPVADTLAVIISQGADFMLYGPMRFAPWVYPAVAAADALVAYGGRLTGVRPVGDGHPLYRVL